VFRHTSGTSHRKLALQLTASLALAACATSPDSVAGSSAGDAVEMSVAFRGEQSDGIAPAVASTSVSASVLANAAQGPTVVGLNGDTLVIESVKVVLDNVRLHKTGVAACVDSIRAVGDDRRAVEAAGCARLDLGAMLLDVPLSARDTAPVRAAIPAGTYRAARISLRRVRRGEGATRLDSAILAANPDLLDASVRVSGRYRNAPFVFYSRASANVEFVFDPPLVVTAGAPDNLTINLRTSKWFTDDAGAILAPNNASNRDRINNKIRMSFQAFGDRRRVGVPDEANRPRRSGSGNETHADTTRGG
jgi:hypothetical protein